jgi:hypothetical protein
MVEVVIEEMVGSDWSRSLDYKRAVVVDAEKKEKERRRKKTKEKTSFRWKERSVFKNSLTGPTLLEMDGNGVYQDLGNRIEKQLGQFGQFFPDSANCVDGSASGTAHPQVLAIGVYGRLFFFQLLVAMRLAIEAVGYKPTCPAASLATVSVGDLSNAPRKELPVHSESHAMSSEHLKAASVVP